MERGQIHSLEGVLAAVLLILSLVFALQVSAVTPMTESTSSQHIENQQKAVSQDLLTASVEDGSLKAAILYWNHDEFRYHESGSDRTYSNGMPDDIRLGNELEKLFTDRGIAYILRVSYIEDDKTSSRRIVNQGEPTDHAVTTTKTITLYDDDKLYDSDGKESGPLLQDAENSYYIPDEGDGSLYNVVEIELITWRM